MSNPIRTPDKLLKLSNRSAALLLVLGAQSDDRLGGQIIPIEEQVRDSMFADADLSE